jgi:hypothetical protein
MPHPAAFLRMSGRRALAVFRSPKLTGQQNPAAGRAAFLYAFALAALIRAGMSKTVGKLSFSGTLQFVSCHSSRPFVHHIRYSLRIRLQCDSWKRLCQFLIPCKN